MRPVCAVMALVLSCVPAYPETATGKQGETPPSALAVQVRTLFALQDAAANGDHEAIKKQQKLIAQVDTLRIAGELVEAPGVLTETAVVGYVLSGGHPALAETIAGSKGLSALSGRLLKGAAFYTRGRTAEAAAELASVDPLQLPPLISGRIALVQAILASGDPVKKQRLLAIAIAAMPGTLVEESALRRSILSYGETGDLGNFWSRSERYLRRFKSSVFAPEFMSSWVLQVVAFEVAAKRPDLAKCRKLLATLTVAQRRALYSLMMRQAARRNLAAITEFAARELREITGGSGSEVASADLYGSIFGIVEARAPAAVETLGGIDRDLLEAPERDLLDAALSIARQIREPVPMAATRNNPRKQDGPAEPPKSSMVLRAELAISNADNLIAAVQR